MGRALFIDIRDKEISTYTFDVKRKRYELRDTRHYPVPERYAFPFDEGTGNIENAYVSLPLGMLNFRVIDLPFSNKERIREVLPFELDGVVLGGSETVVFDDIVTGMSEGRHQILVVYIEKKVLEEILEKLKPFGIDPVFLTSVELRHALKDFALSKLLSPVQIEEEDRIALAIEEINAPVIDLRRDEFSYTRDIESTKKSLKFTAVLAALIFLVIASDIVFSIISTRAEINSLKNEIRRKYQVLFPGEKNIVNEVHQLKSHMKELRDKEDVLIGVNPLNPLLKLSQVDREGVVFNEVSVDRLNLALKGEAASLSEIQKLQDRMKSLFDEVAIVDSKASAQGRMLFTITAREKRV
jgi:type II secretory pathway component PulL